MEGVVDRGTGEARADPRLHRRGKDRARRRSWWTAATAATPTTTCRSSASCRRESRCSRSSWWSIHRTASRRMAGSWPRRSSRRSPPRRFDTTRVPQSINAPEPLLVRRVPARRSEQPASGPIAPPRIVPLGGSPSGVGHGLPGSHRHERARRASRAGAAWAHPRLQGTGVVVQQYPPAGEPIDSASHGRAQARPAKRSIGERRPSHDRCRTPPRARPGAGTDARLRSRRGGGALDADPAPASPTIRAGSARGAVFVALLGLKANGAMFAPQAIAAGAVGDRRRKPPPAPTSTCRGLSSATPAWRSRGCQPSSSSIPAAR